MPLILGALLFAALVGWIAWSAGRAHTVAELRAGKLVVRRGALPPALLRDLADLARDLPQARGRIELRGRGETLDVRCPDLDEVAAQRARNAVLFHRRSIRG